MMLKGCIKCFEFVEIEELNEFCPSCHQESLITFIQALQVINSFDDFYLETFGGQYNYDDEEILTNGLEYDNKSSFGDK